MGLWCEQGAPEGGVGVWPQPLGSQAQVKVQMKKFHYPMGANDPSLGCAHSLYGCSLYTFLYSTDTNSNLFSRHFSMAATRDVVRASKQRG